MVKSISFIFNVVNFYGDTPILTLCIHKPTCVYVGIVNINNIKSSLSLIFDRNLFIMNVNKLRRLFNVKSQKLILWFNKFKIDNSHSLNNQDNRIQYKIRRCNVIAYETTKVMIYTCIVRNFIRKCGMLDNETPTHVSFSDSMEGNKATWSV